MIYEILLPLPINKTFYYLGARSSKDLCKGSLVEVEFKKKVMIHVKSGRLKTKNLFATLTNTILEFLMVCY